MFVSSQARMAKLRPRLRYARLGGYRVAGLKDVQRRIATVLQNAEHDAESVAEFADLVNNILDKFAMASRAGFDVGEMQTRGLRAAAGAWAWPGSFFE